MSVHLLQEVFFCHSVGKIQGRIQCQECEYVAMCPERRAWTAVPGMAEIVPAYSAA